ncbi:MAG: RtcB family protein [Planctomycetia bacterium]|nr:RtcB family protein [Planctomycetia bacterium]
MSKYTYVSTGEATGKILIDGKKPIRLFGDDAIRETISDVTLDQAYVAATAPGVEDVVLTPDAHEGYGFPIGCVMTSDSCIYPSPVGVDINCSMSLLQTDLPEEAIAEKPVRRAIIRAIEERIPTFGRERAAHKRPNYLIQQIEDAIVLGATPEVAESLDFPVEWTQRCEQASFTGHNGTPESLLERLEKIKAPESDIIRNYGSKLFQLGSYGGGNHFAECEVVRLADSQKNRTTKIDGQTTAEVFGLLDGKVAFLSHCGSRGFGHSVATAQFKKLREKFELWHIPFPGGIPELVYAPLGTQEANDYIDDMNMCANYAVVNHMVINSLILKAFQEVIPGTTGRLVYHISHNIARREYIDNRPVWVHRKGSTRAFPAGHFALKSTPFAHTGHPILLPGNPLQGSSVMVACENAKESFYSVNHGAGRAMSRQETLRTLVQRDVDREFEQADILINARQYPLDEAPKAYKDFNEVLRSVELAGLAREVARLDARFVIKDSK